MKPERMMTSEDASLTVRALLVVLLAAAIIVGLAFANAAKAETFLPHPAGCPAKRFCGCGASVEIFGKPIRSLWPSTAWFKFPRSAPGYNKVAVRRGHVFVLKRHLQGNVWLAADFNSGRNRSRLHARSIAGYRIVDPRAVNIAEAQP